MSLKRMRVVLFLIAAFSVAAGAVGTPRADAQNAPGTGAAPVKTPDPTIRFAHDVVFTIVLGSDTPTDSKIAVALAARLKSKARNDLGLPVKNAWIVPEGSWSLADYLQQCAQDSHTQGAFIVLPPSSAAASDNWIVLLQNTTTVSFSIMIAQCDHSGSPPVADWVAGPPPPSPAPRPGDNASVVWVSNPSKGKFGRSQVEIFPLAVLTSIYLAFAPQRTYQTTTTVAYPAPNPLPSNGARTNVQTLQGSVLDGQGAGAVQNNVLGAFSGNGLGSTIGAAGNPDFHTIHAADDAIGHLLNEQLDTYCKDPAAPGPPSAPGPHGFCAW
jgi:hypothetical protein